jgi:hypothetical protein
MTDQAATIAETPRTVTTFRAWLARSQPGDVIYQYYEGNLARDRQKDPELNVLANIIWEAYISGKCHPVQRRIDSTACACLGVRGEFKPITLRWWE